MCVCGRSASFHFFGIFSYIFFYQILASRQASEGFFLLQLSAGAPVFNGIWNKIEIAMISAHWSSPASCTYRFSLRIDCKVRDASLSTRCLRCQSMYNQGVFSEILQVALWKVSAHECFLISWILRSHLAGMIWVLQCTAASYCHFLLLSFILSSRLWLSPVS